MVKLVQIIECVFAIKKEDKFLKSQKIKSQIPIAFSLKWHEI